MKTFTLAAAAALALTAIAAQATQASEEPRFTGAPTGLATYNDASQAFHAFGGEISCQHGEFEVERLATADTATVEAAYASCTAYGQPATLEMNSCDYRFHVEGTDPGDRDFEGTTDIACGVEGDVISVAVFGSQEAHENDNPICHIFFPEQEGLEGLRLDNSGEHVDLTGKAGGITATQIRTSIFCPQGTHETAGEMTIEEALTVEGENHAEEAQSISIEGEVASPEFTGAPTGLTTFSDGSQAFHAFGGEVRCQHAEFAVERLADPSQATVEPIYKDCEAFGLPATVVMTSCDYVFNVNGPDPGGHDFTGTADVTCEEAGDTIDITIFGSQEAHEENNPICHIFVPEQNGLEGLRFNNNGEHVDVTGNVSGIEATQVRESFVCPAGTETSNGEYTIEEPVTVEGENHLGEPEAIGIS